MNYRPVLVYFIACIVIFMAACGQKKNNIAPSSSETTSVSKRDTSAIPQLTLAEANRLSSMPYECMQTEYPNKLNQTLNEASHIASPKVLHPSFYGCFDWHSSVHGHWSLVSLLKRYPDLNHAADIRKKLRTNISKENILKELEYFEWKGNSSYERTYGWAWLLKLSEELYTWDDDLGRELYKNLKPMSDMMAQGFIDFLPKLYYPIRLGTHNNTAFGLSMAYDYAETMKDDKLKSAIHEAVERYYSKDVGCPYTWEPSGFDFLSPCLEEADLVRKVYAKDKYRAWLKEFMPQLTDPSFSLEPGRVLDRADGKLVHLDGLNFSRAWCLYGIANTLPEYEHLNRIADEHIAYSLPTIVDDNYSGTHWLGSFALYALYHVN